MTIPEYLLQDREQIPEWLSDYNSENRPKINTMLQSRVVFYPGAGVDGTLVKIFNKGHAAHVYLYVDYLYTKEEINEKLSDTAFAGYHLIDSAFLSENELVPNGFKIHYSKADMIRLTNLRTREYITDNTNGGFCVLKVYERNDDLGDEHGAKRFALLYLGADAYPSYDAIFGNGNANLFAALVENYAFGNEYGAFGKNSLLELVSKKTGIYPKYLICASYTQIWDGYTKLDSVDSYFVNDRIRCLWHRE